jgi:hypothetical protein
VTLAALVPPAAVTEFATKARLPSIYERQDYVDVAVERSTLLRPMPAVAAVPAATLQLTTLKKNGSIDTATGD